MGAINNPIANFWSKVEKTSDCWLWKGAIGKGGYGNFWDGQRFVRAHRYSYQLAFGDLSASMLVLHKCDVRNCVNPAHLFQGTYQDNATDMKQKGRSATGEKNGLNKHPEVRKCGESNPRAKLSAKQVQDIRHRRAAGNVSNRQLAKEYCISETQMSRIISGQRWNKHG